MSIDLWIELLSSWKSICDQSRAQIYVQESMLDSDIYAYMAEEKRVRVY